MSKINYRAAAVATVILSLGFAAAGAAPALADVGPTQISPRATLQDHVPGLYYAGPALSSRPVTQWATGPNLHFARGTHVASCDLPSSGCADNERITN